MALYTFAQLEGLWEQAGGSHKLAPLMAAIALAESHPPGDATHADSNATGGVGEKGLWQINPHAWGNLATYDPLGNARAAVHVLSAQGLGAWSTYNSGAYKHFLSSAAPVTPPTTGGHGPGHPQPAPGQTGTVNPGVGTGLSGSTSGGGLAQWVENAWPALGLSFSLPGLSAFSDVAQALVGLTAPFTKFAVAIDWFFVPSHWIRIFAGIAGVGLGIGGVYELAHSGDDHPTALPAGIAMTGAGGVLLFVAFHNLDPSIKTVGELLADLQGKLQTSGGATTSPQAAVTAAGG